MVDDIVVRCGVGRRFAGLGAMKGESRDGSSVDARAPLKMCGEFPSWMVGVFGSSGAGVTLVGLRETNESSSVRLFFHAGDPGRLRPLRGRPKGLDGRSEELLIWLGLRTNGLVFSEDRMRLLLLCLVGDEAGDALLVCRLNGEVRPIAERRFGFVCIVAILLLWYAFGSWRDKCVKDPQNESQIGTSGCYGDR